jgi:hypothetical protein
MRSESFGSRTAETFMPTAWVILLTTARKKERKADETKEEMIDPSERK